MAVRTKEPKNVFVAEELSNLEQLIKQHQDLKELVAACYTSIDLPPGTMLNYLSPRVKRSSFTLNHLLNMIILRDEFPNAIDKGGRKYASITNTTFEMITEHTALRSQYERFKLDAMPATIPKDKLPQISDLLSRYKLTTISEFEHIRESYKELCGNGAVDQARRARREVNSKFGLQEGDLELVCKILKDPSLLEATNYLLAQPPEQELIGQFVAKRHNLTDKELTLSLLNRYRKDYQREPWHDEFATLMNTQSDVSGLCPLLKDEDLEALSTIQSEIYAGTFKTLRDQILDLRRRVVDDLKDYVTNAVVGKPVVMIQRANLLKGTAESVNGRTLQSIWNDAMLHFEGGMIEALDLAVKESKLRYAGIPLTTYEQLGALRVITSKIYNELSKSKDLQKLHPDSTAVKKLCPISLKKLVPNCEDKVPETFYDLLRNYVIENKNALEQLLGYEILPRMIPRPKGLFDMKDAMNAVLHVLYAYKAEDGKVEDGLLAAGRIKALQRNAAKSGAPSEIRADISLLRTSIDYLATKYGDSGWQMFVDSTLNINADEIEKNLGYLPKGDSLVARRVGSIATEAGLPHTPDQLAKAAEAEEQMIAYLSDSKNAPTQLGSKSLDKVSWKDEHLGAVKAQMRHLYAQRQSWIQYVMGFLERNGSKIEEVRGESVGLDKIFRSKEIDRHRKHYQTEQAGSPGQD